MKARELNTRTLEKYKHIVDYWFNNEFNGAGAYRKFYKNIKSNETATTNFSRIQALPEIKQYILEKHEEARRFVQMDHEGILEELKRWVQADITETLLLTAEEIKALPIELKRLITKYKARIKSHYDNKGFLVSTEEIIELHFVSKERAIEMITRHLGFYGVDNLQKKPDIHIGVSNSDHTEIIKGIIEGKE